MKHVFFDLDGTLVDPLAGITQSVAYALEKQGMGVENPHSLAWVIGPALIDSFQKLGVADPQRALQDYRERYLETGLFECRVYDGIPGVLAQLVDRGVQLHLATAKPHSYARIITRHFGLSPFMTHEFGPELDGTRNDKGELLEYALATTGINACDAVMVGDRIFDINAARCVGMRAIGVTWGYGDQSETDRADSKCARTADLVRTIENTFSGGLRH